MPTAASASDIPGPYVGDYEGVAWNAQGFFRSRTAGYAAQRRFVQQLLSRRDFVMLSETHVTPGSRLGYKQIPGTQAWWSCGTAARAGVGIVVKQSFLDKFTLAEPEWMEPEAGRLATLRLHGASGNLDLVVCYLPTGVARSLHPGIASACPSTPHLCDVPPAILRAQREAMVRRIPPLLRPTEAMTVLGGDFNFVVSNEDRWNKSSGEFTGHHDSGEAAHWRRTVASSLLYELVQLEPTHEGPVSFGRLDRVYTNQPVVSQLDKRVFAVLLPWSDLSQHRPLAFGRTSRPLQALSTKAIPDEVVADERWPLQVAAEFHDLLDVAQDIENPLTRLRLLKAAMRSVSVRFMEERSAGSYSPASTSSLDVVMAALRRLERGGMLELPGLCARYPPLRQLLPDALLQHAPGRCLGILRSHALELARSAAVESLQRLHEDLPNLDATTLSQRRTQVLQQLKRVAPGRSASLPAVVDSDGHLLTDGPGMAAALRKHWSEVFAARRLDHDLRGAWFRTDASRQSGLRAAVRPLLGDASAWRLRRSDVRRAVDMSSKSSPGPDGVPYSAWRRLGPLAVDTLHAAAAELAAAEGSASLLSAFPLGSEGNTDFNQAIIVFIPKKVDREINGIRCCEPGDVRPLSIVNTDNRLMANAVRVRVEPLLASAISPAQRGFLPGRSMLHNVVELDCEMRAASLRHERAAAVFFDFAAAFPSLAHDFMMAALTFLGLPHSFVNFIRNLYLGNGCQISAAGELHKGFGIRAGIRQGCPLSPLLFALCGDLLLRRLLHDLPTHDLMRAYADDVGLAAADIFDSANIFAPLFTEYAAVSGLALNLSKTVFVPLSDDLIQQFRADLEQRWPGWGAAQVRGWADYLGFTLGPEAGTRTWTKAFAKYEKRAALWAQLGLGLHHTTVAYNVYIASLLGFLLQLEVLPASWASLEAATFRKLVPGPAHWIMPADLHELSRHHGMPHSFSNLSEVSLAARFRVAHREAARAGGLKVQDQVRRLTQLYQDTPHLYRSGRWRQWFLNSFVHNLQAAVLEFGHHGICIRSIEADLGAQAPRPHTRAQERRLSHGVQRAARAALSRTIRTSPEIRLRQKLDRWPLPLFPRIRAMRAATVLQRLRGLIPPRAVAAVLRTWFNGWCTRRRFQQASDCLFGCTMGADSLEHYIRCSKLHRHGESWLRLPLPSTLEDRGVHFLLLAPRFRLDDDTLIRRALLLTAAYRLHCSHRRGSPFTDDEVLRRALAQAVKEAAVGHTRAVRSLDSIWSSGSTAPASAIAST